MVKTARLFFAASLSIGCLAAARIPQFFVDSVVALGRFEPNRGPGQPSEWVTEASGFLYGYPADNETDPAKHRYHVYLVANRHVLANHSQILVRMNAEKATDLVREFTLALKDNAGADLWVSHPSPSTDVSVIGINAQFLHENGLQSAFFAGDKHTADKAKMKNIGLSIGDEVFVLGFPMGLSGTAQRNFVIARRGSIARLSDVFESAATTFLIDSLVFPGNSGGPVVSVPDLNSIEGTKSQNAAYLIGVVRGYLPYTDVAVSQQTGQLRMITQENSGLAEIIPVDYIDETIRAAMAAEAKRQTPPKQ
jgi:S1-C subfamily serine protease